MTNEFLNEIFLNKSFLAAFSAWFITQCLKVLISAIKEKRFDFKWFVSTGGFPSTHSAIVSALATSIGLNFGFGSGLFAIAMVLAGIVIFDARIIRKAAGKQAEVLNKILKDLNKKEGFKTKRLRELLGHTSIEVFGGIVFGILIASMFY